MNRPEDVSTKKKILFASVRLFSQNGFENVTTREIAKAVGITVGSIYNHFPSKTDILRECYAFYGEQQRLAAPPLEQMLRLAETEPVPDLLTRLNFQYPPGLQETLVLILGIATHRASIDGDSSRFIEECYFAFYRLLWIPVLSRLIELRRIEPIDVDTFMRLMGLLGFTAVSLNTSALNVDRDQWNQCLAMAFSLLKPTGNVPATAHSTA